MRAKKVIIKIFLSVIFALGFAVFLAPVFTNIINIGNAAGMTVCAALFGLTVFWSRFYALLQKSAACRRISAVILSVAAALLILAAVISVFMVTAANSPPSGGSTVIILGCKVRGETPSLMLYHRAMAAYKYLEANPDAVCIASGGQGADELISEAECIRRILTEKGIADERIILEDKSTSTDENIRFSAQKMEEYGISGSIAIVTSEYHQLRAKMIAGKYGLESYSISARTAVYLLPTYWLREWFGVCYQFVFGGTAANVQNT